MVDLLPGDLRHALKELRGQREEDHEIVQAVRRRGTEDPAPRADIAGEDEREDGQRRVDDRVHRSALWPGATSDQAESPDRIKLLASKQSGSGFRSTLIGNRSGNPKAKFRLIDG